MTLAAPIKPSLDSRLASCHLRTFIVFHRFSWFSIDFHRFSQIFIDFDSFSYFSGHGDLMTLGTTCCPYRNLCSIPGWLLVICCHLRTFSVFHRFVCFSIDFSLFPYVFADFDRFSCISGYGCLRHKAEPAALIETFARFQAGFLSSEDFHSIL